MRLLVVLMVLFPVVLMVELLVVVFWAMVPLRMVKIIKLHPHEQKHKHSWIKAKQKFSSAQLQ
jgi:hypothetical protein